MKKKRVVIDCGHGGQDPGAIGCFGLKEKDVCLKIGITVAKILRAQGYSIFLTRHADASRSLEQRINAINCCEPADALISIHANAASNVGASGIETFCLKPSLFSNPGTVEAGQKTKKVVELYHARQYARSQNLARCIQEKAVSSARTVCSSVVDRNVRHGVAQLFIGTEVPAALIEIGFLTNKKEARLLASRRYQVAVAQGICNGLLAFLNQKNN